MHIGRTNLHYNYHIQSVQIPVSDEVRDLGILTDKNLTYRSQISKISSMAKSHCGLFFRTFIYRQADLLMLFFDTHVHPTLEYASIVCFLARIEYINRIKNVQRYFTKKIALCERMCYKDRWIFYELIACNIDE